jgi:hypothetical protein
MQIFIYNRTKTGTNGDYCQRFQLLINVEGYWKNADNKTSCVIVVEENKPVDIIAEKDTIT